jgi:hypothetical protein
LGGNLEVTKQPPRNKKQMNNKKNFKQLPTIFFLANVAPFKSYVVPRNLYFSKEHLRILEVPSFPDFLVDQ